MSVHAGEGNLNWGVGISTRDEAYLVTGWNSYPEDEISPSCMDWLMLDSFSPTCKWIVLRAMILGHGHVR